MTNPPEKEKLLKKINAPVKKIEEAARQIKTVETGNLSEPQQRAINNIKKNYKEFIRRMDLYLEGNDLA